MAKLLHKSHRILEKGRMEFRPFGKEVNGERIQDVSGLTVRANLEYLHQVVLMRAGEDAANRSTEELVQSLNERIPDQAYHVTLDVLKNPWNSYSYEFVMFLTELCVSLSGDPHFHSNLGRHKVLSPIVQNLGRPFSMTQIYALWPYFAEKFTKGALVPQIVMVTNGRAVMRLQFSERTSRQFGIYQRGCAERICQTVKCAIAEVPALMFGLRPATIQDHCCMSDGEEYCEWIFTWEPQKSKAIMRPLLGILAGLVMVFFLRLQVPDLTSIQALGLALLPGGIIWVGETLWQVRQRIRRKEFIIQEQLQAAETRHEELREAYLLQEEITLDLKRRIAELTMLHQMGMYLGSTLEKDVLINVGLQAIIKELGYDRAMIAFYEEDRGLAHDVYAVGVPSDLAAWLRHQSLFITGEYRLETQILNQGISLLIKDIQEVRRYVHPHLQQCIEKLGTKTFIAVPLKIQNRVVGVLAADRMESHSLTSQDLNVLNTLANQIAIALDHAKAYTEIEQLNIGLEFKVHERTAKLQKVNGELQSANERLQELDQLKSQFLSYCSHELRTPLTAIKGYTELMMKESPDSMSQEHQLYLSRIHSNIDRLTRMIADLLDLARIESGTIHMVKNWVDLTELLQGVIEELQLMARPKGQGLQLTCPQHSLFVMGDYDRLQQIVMNLIHNALKFTPENGDVLVELFRDLPTTVTLVVSDTGPGIPDEVRDKLFEPFFQATRERALKSRGLGLGLSIVKNLVDLHGGSIQVESQMGKGTTFRVSLPKE